MRVLDNDSCRSLRKGETLFFCDPRNSPRKGDSEEGAWVGEDSGHKHPQAGQHGARRGAGPMCQMGGGGAQASQDREAGQGQTVRALYTGL